MTALSVRWMAALLAGMLMTAQAAVAQTYPTKPIRYITPYPAGGQADIVARVIAQGLSKQLGQPVVVDNRPGAGGAIGIDALQTSLPDGYTLLQADAGQWGINPALRTQSYDPEKDLAPIGKVATSSLFIAANQSVPVKDVKELIEYAKKNPGKLTYGSSGNGTLHHLSMEAFKAAFNLDIVHIPFRGTAQSVPALAGGQTSLAIAGLQGLAPFIETGQVKLMVANTKNRSQFAPAIPSMAEIGAPEVDFPGDSGLFAPVGTSATIVARISAALEKVLSDSDVVQHFKGAGVESLYSTADELKLTIGADLVKYRNAVKVAGAKVD